MRFWMQTRIRWPTWSLQGRTTATSSVLAISSPISRRVLPLLHFRPSICQSICRYTAIGQSVGRYTLTCQPVGRYSIPTLSDIFRLLYEVPPRLCSLFVLFLFTMALQWSSPLFLLLMPSRRPWVIRALIILVVCPVFLRFLMQFASFVRWCISTSRLVFCKQMPRSLQRDSLSQLDFVSDGKRVCSEAKSPSRFGWAIRSVLTWRSSIHCRR